MSQSLLHATSTELRCLREVNDWRRRPAAGTFPFTTIVEYVRSVGKHFVAAAVLEALDEVRSELDRAPVRDAEHERIRAFLALVLDKFDGRYDYATYTCLTLLALPESDGWAACRSQRDRLLVLLLADAMAFEVGSITGARHELSQMRAEPELVKKRCRHALRVMSPALQRLRDAGRLSGVAAPAGHCAHWSIDAWGSLAASVLAQASGEELLALELSMLPVYVVHDEYMFIRVLQASEANFQLMVAQLSEASQAAHDDRPAHAATLIRAAAAALDEARPLFSLMGSMRREAFSTFRTYTEGASAIQSANYKRFEALCAQPRAERLDSDAFRSVPGVRADVLDGRYAPVQSAVAAAIDGGRWDADGAREVREAALALEDVHARWKQTHYRLAMRMIGERPGTGYTSGTPYLRGVLENRLFGASSQPAAAPSPQLLAREVMNTAPVTISEDADVRQAVDLVVSGRANDLMVLGPDGRFAGLLAEGDILRRALPDRDEILAAGGSVDDAYRVFLRRGMELAGESIKPMIIRRPVLVRPDDHVGKLATILVERHMRTLAVVDGDRLVGSLSRGDVCKALVGAR